MSFMELFEFDILLNLYHRAQRLFKIRDKTKVNIMPLSYTVHFMPIIIRCCIVFHYNSYNYSYVHIYNMHYATAYVIIGP